MVKLGEPAAAIPLRAGANTLNFSAKYYSPQGNATAGDGVGRNRAGITRRGIALR